MRHLNESSSVCPRLLRLHLRRKINIKFISNVKRDEDNDLS